MPISNQFTQPSIVQEQNESKESNLNFKNEKSVEQINLAKQDLKAAKVLAKVSKATDSKDTSTKKALNRKAKQTAMEAVEHAQKAVTLADDKHTAIKNDKVHKNLEKTHNNKFMQREQEKAGINILEKIDIEDLNSKVKKKDGEKSPYNAVRFSEQKIDDESVDKAIAVAQKAVDNVEKKAKESENSSNDQNKITVGGVTITYKI